VRADESNYDSPVDAVLNREPVKPDSPFQEGQACEEQHLHQSEVPREEPREATQTG
jgi:hypothetical protein